MAAEPAPAPAEPAPAKVNLYLHLRGRRPDGYHLLESLVAFPSIGDSLAATRADALSLKVDGPFAAALAGETDNLVLRAARALALAHGIAAGATLVLTKNLPVASGIGGGSSDAAAALRLLSRLWDVPVPEGLAMRLGADVPVCLRAPTPQLVAGIGEKLTPAMSLPRFWMVLANPGGAVATGAVFAAVKSRDNPPGPPPGRLTTFAELTGWLALQRNDLEAAAVSVCPAIAEVLAALGDAPLSRMSGSGATCFALHPDERTARAQAGRIARAEPDWWIAAAPVG